MTKLPSYLILVALGFTSSYAHAQSYPPGFQDYMSSAYKGDTEDANGSSGKNTKTPQANFFPGGRSSDSFFQDKSVTPNLPGPDRKITFGTDQFHNPTEVAVPAPAPEIQTEQASTTEPENTQEENWAADKNQETEEVKNFNENIEKASVQISNEPRVQDVLAQSKKIKEALFGKSNSAKPSESKSTVASKNPEKVTKEIERF